MKKEFNKTFWVNGFEGKGIGGIWYKGPGLNRFLKEIETKLGLDIVGLRFEEGSVEIMVKTNLPIANRMNR